MTAPVHNSDRTFAAPPEVGTATSGLRAGFPDPRAAYIHVPFCKHRCGYCNFTVVAGRSDLVEPYLQALAIELSWLERPRPVDTLFFGGGTPTELEPEALDQLLQLVRKWFVLSDGYEWSVEANPETLDAARSEVLARHGVNRISLGVQSFSAQKLEKLERGHRREQIERAWALARSIGASLSCDLIFAAPDETLESWLADLEAAIALAPDHVSTYGLTFERGTTFWSRLQKSQLQQLDEDLQAQMYLRAIERLEQGGWEHYEVSNFARPGHRCRHNQTYWRGEGYYAAGPGAARYVHGRRETNHRSTTTWLRRVLQGQSAVAEREQLEPEQRAREQLVFGLRQLEGVERQAFAEKTGFEIDQLVREPLQRFVEWGLLQDDGERIRLSRRGLLVSDALWPEFL